jgi:hypothetical protein
MINKQLQSPDPDLDAILDSIRRSMKESFLKGADVFIELLPAFVAKVKSIPGLFQKEK